MKSPQSNHPIHALILAGLFAAGSAGASDYFPFRVAFENVPGVSAITNGSVSAGIQILEQELEQGTANKGDVLATLCGAHILESSLEKAAQVCTDAVETSPGETAFNNRGVLRAFTGDFGGAREDFDRARPQDMAEYLEYLKSRDVGLIANGNHDILQGLAARHTPADVNASVAMSIAARVEQIEE